MRPRTSIARAGFTLVELLVSITLILVLAGLAILFIPRINEGQNNTRAATQLQQWINIAKQMAAKDRAPRGIRLLPGKTNIVQVTDLEYIEEPEPYTLGAVAFTGGGSGYLNLKTQSTATVNAAGTTVNFTNNSRLLTGGFTTPGEYPVQPGDYLELAGVPYKINTINANGTRLTLTTAAPASLVTTNYRILRQPRPIGDDPLQMAENIIIDLTPRGIAGGKYDLPAPGTVGLDILFAPDGRVIGSLAVYDQIILWVRDVTLADGLGDPALVVIYPRTGLIAVHPVDTTNLTTSPYTFTTTGRRSSF
jgi:prepilin-type N-terminal cleavage/methylation domain-containing protein